MSSLYVIHSKSALKSVYHPGFGGAYSLKSELPALVAQMTYESMQVADRQGAGLAWESLVRGELPPEECERIRMALLAYCGQDTLGMLRLLERFQHPSV